MPSKVTKYKRGRLVPHAAMKQYVAMENRRHEREKCSVCGRPGASYEFDMAGRCDDCAT